MNKPIYKVTKHSLIYGFGNFSTKAIAFFLLPLYTSYLTTADYGILQICNVFSSALLIILLLGMNSSMFRVYYNTENNIDRKRIINSTYNTYFLFSMIFLFPLFLFSGSLSKIFIGLNGHSYLFNIILISTFFEGLFNLQLAYLRSEEKSKLYALVNIIRIIFYAGLNVLFIAHLRRNYVGVREVTLISLFIIIIFAMPKTFKNFRFEISKKHMKDILHIGIPLAIGGLGIWILNLTDRYMLKYLLPENIAFSQIGVYSLGAKISSIIRFVLVAPFMLAWGSMMFSYQNHPQAKLIFANVLKYFTFIAGIFFLLVSIFAKEVIIVMAQQESYYSAYKVVPLMNMSKILYGIYITITVGVTLTKKTIYVVYSNYSAALCNIVLNFLLIPILGIFGAALASMVSYVINVIIIYYFAKKFYPINYEINKIILYLFLISLAVALILHLQFNIIQKVFIFLLITILLPFSKLVTFNQIKISLKKIFVKIKNYYENNFNSKK